MIKLLTTTRIISFIIMVFTSIPLFVHYIKATTPARELIMDLHVIFGAIFILTAIPSMVISKIKNKGNTKHETR